MQVRIRTIVALLGVLSCCTLIIAVWPRELVSRPSVNRILKLVNNGNHPVSICLVRHDNSCLVHLGDVESKSELSVRLFEGESTQEFDTAVFSVFSFNTEQCGHRKFTGRELDSINLTIIVP